MFTDFLLPSINRHRHCRRFGGFLFLPSILGALVVSLVAVHESTRSTGRRLIDDLQQAEKEQFHQRINYGVMHIRNDASTNVTTVATAAASDAASNNKSNWEEYDNRPWFVMHVGPPKTATTFLQCSICVNYYSHHEQFFRQDNYTYIGTCDCPGNARFDDRFVGHSHGAIFRFPLTWNTNHSQGPFPFPKTPMNSELPMLRRSFRLRLKKVHDQGRNALFIFEGCHKFDSFHVAALAKYLKPLFRTRIIVSYRRLYAWLPSKYNSIRKPIRNKDIANWPGHFHVHRDGKLSKSIELQPFHLNFDPSDNVNNDMDHDDFDQLVHDIVAAQQHPTQTIRDNYAQYFDHVHVIPLHVLPDESHLSVHANGVFTTTTDSDDNTAAIGNNNATKTVTATISPYLYHLFCILLVETTHHICRAVVQGEFHQRSSPIENHSVSLDYDRIAVTAHERGWIPSNASRGEIAQHVQKHIYEQQQRIMQEKEAETNDNRKETILSIPKTTPQRQHVFPKECLPNTTLDRLLSLSLTTEENLFGYERAMQWRDEHIRAFERYRQRSKYCWLDSNKLLDQSDEWKSFLQKLGQSFAMEELLRTAEE